MKKLKFARHPAADSEPKATEASATSSAPATPATRGRFKLGGKRKRDKKAKVAKVKLKKIPGSWKLIRLAFGDFRRDWKRYVLILAIVAVPINIAGVFNLVNADPLAGSYLSLFSLMMNVAVIWAMTRRELTGTMPSLAESYYDGSVALIRFVISTVLVLIMLLPAALGIAIYMAALLAQDTSGVSGPEIIGVGIVALALASPSYYLLTRYLLAPFGAIRDKLRPIAALRRSRIYTLGRFWQISGRFWMLLIYLAILALPPYLLSQLLTKVKWTGVGNFLFETLVTVAVLPIANLYVLRLYRALEESFNERAATQLDGMPVAEAATLDNPA